MPSINFKAILQDRKRYIEECLYIKSTRGLINLKFNKPQQKLYRTILNLEAAQKPVRILVLKARQMGLSTWIGAYIFAETSSNRYVNSMVMAHKDESATYLFDIYKRFFKHLPDEIKPLTTYSSRKELVYSNPEFETAPPQLRETMDPGLDSRLSVITAGGDAVGRSQTINNLHWSEVAFTKDAEAVHDAVLQAVPKPPYPGRVFYESTANGSSGLFYDLFWDAWRGKSAWTPVFIPWFEYEAYAMPAGPSFALSHEEYKIKERYKLSNDQMAWRRWVLNTDLRGDVGKFQQEYPSNPEEAFQAKTNAAFSLAALGDMRTQVRDKLADADFTADGLVEIPNGSVKIWEWPKEDSAYVIGVDASEGLTEGCAPVAQVIRATTAGPVQVAVYSERVQPLEFALKVYRLGLFYNTALVNPERNQQGAAILAILLDKKYPRVYIADDGRYGTYAGELGATIMVNELAHVIWKRELEIRDEQTFNALSCYELKNGRYAGKEDDYVDALRAAIHALPKATRPRRQLEIARQSWSGWNEETWDIFASKNVR